LDQSPEKRARHANTNERKCAKRIKINNFILGKNVSQTLFSEFVDMVIGERKIVEENSFLDIAETAISVCFASW